MADEEIFDMEEGEESPSSPFDTSPLKRQITGGTATTGSNSFEKVELGRRVSIKRDPTSSPKQGRRSLLTAELKRSGGVNQTSEGIERQQTGKGVPLQFDRIKKLEEDAGNDSSEDEEFHQRMRDRQRMLRAANSLEGSSMMSASLPANIDRTRAKYFRSLNLLPQQGGAGGGREGGKLEIDEDAMDQGAVPMATGTSRPAQQHSSSQPISINTTGVDDEESGSEHDDGIDPTFVPPHKLIARGCFSVADVQVKPKKFGQL